MRGKEEEKKKIGKEEEKVRERKKNPRVFQTSKIFLRVGEFHILDTCISC